MCLNTVGSYRCLVLDDLIIYINRTVYKDGSAKSSAITAESPFLTDTWLIAFLIWIIILTILVIILFICLCVTITRNKRKSEEYQKQVEKLKNIKFQPNWILKAGALDEITYDNASIEAPSKDTKPPINGKNGISPSGGDEQL